MSPIQERGGHKIVPCLHAIGDGEKLGRLTRRCGQCSYSSFQSGYPFFEDIRGRVHQTGVDVAEFLQAEEVGTMFCVVKDVRARLVNRYGSCIGGGIRHLTGMELQCLEALICHVFREGCVFVLALC